MVGCLDATGLNTFVTIVGIFVTVGSVWAAWYLSMLDRRKQRIHSVVAEFLRIRRKDSITDVLEDFVDAGATALSQREMVDAAAQLAEAGFQNPMSDPSFPTRDIIVEAKRQGVDFDDFISRISFLVSTLPQHNHNQTHDTPSRDESNTKSPHNGEGGA